MIESLEIKKFKSIVQAKVKFSPLTVLVGMNGAGKSNLMLALAFLSHVSNHGLTAAVNQFGGFSSLLPQMELPSAVRSLPVGQSAKIAFCPPRGGEAHSEYVIAAFAGRASRFSSDSQV
jgi:energy-coupling factor transporter ATP-binding protein EcfA2